MSARTKGHISRQPIHRGDGYDWGGDLIVTLGATSINLGYPDQTTIELAHKIAAAEQMYEALKEVAHHADDECGFMMDVEAALTAARGVEQSR